MKLEYGNMFKEAPADSVLIATGNAFIRVDGAVVMGRGAAAQMAKIFPYCPFSFAATFNHLSPYHLRIIRGYHPGANNFWRNIGLFQVKRHFKDAADLELIRQSTDRLVGVAALHPYTRYDMNYPGIGNGKLHRGEVAPIIGRLPNNVHIWQFKE